MSDPRNLKGLDRIELALDTALELYPDEPLFKMAKTDFGLMKQSIHTKEFASLVLFDLIAEEFKT